MPSGTRAFRRFAGRGKAIRPSNAPARRAPAASPLASTLNRFRLCALMMRNLPGGETVNEIEQAAQMSIGRACGFAGFGIALTVLALSFEPALAAKTGAALTLGLALALLVFAYRAHNTPYQTTEVWLLIDRDSRPPARHARRVINEARRFAMLWFARWAAAVSALFASSAILLALARTA
jgi:hypothetical protein